MFLNKLFQPWNFLCLVHAAFVVFFSSGVSAKVWPSHKPLVLLKGIFPSRVFNTWLKGWCLSRPFLAALHIGPPMRSVGRDWTKSHIHRLNFYKIWWKNIQPQYLEKRLLVPPHRRRIAIKGNKNTHLPRFDAIVPPDKDALLHLLSHRPCIEAYMWQTMG